jgi:phosphohistidine phosphatase SixA
MKTHLALLVSALALLLPHAAYADPPAADAVLPQLQKGGYVIFMRHPKTNEDQADTDPLHLENVQAQRQLSDEGRQQARSIGESFRTLRIPVEKVISSKFQRAQEAARLLELGEVTTSIDCSEGGLVVSPRENKRRAAALKALLGTRPAAGKNLIIVSHRPNLLDAAGKDLADVGEGEMVVFEPLGESQFEVVARVAQPETWLAWARQPSQGVGAAPASR